MRTHNNMNHVENDKLPLDNNIILFVDKYFFEEIKIFISFFLLPFIFECFVSQKRNRITTTDVFYFFCYFFLTFFWLYGVSYTYIYIEIDDFFLSPYVVRRYTHTGKKKFKKKKHYYAIRK